MNYLKKIGELKKEQAVFDSELKTIQGKKTAVVDQLRQYQRLHSINVEKSVQATKLLAGRSRQNMYEIIAFLMSIITGTGFYTNKFENGASFEEIMKDVTFFDFLLVEIGESVITSIKDRFLGIDIIEGEAMMDTCPTFKGNASSNENFSKRFIAKMEKKSVKDELIRRVAEYDPDAEIETLKPLVYDKIIESTKEETKLTIKNIFKMTGIGSRDLLLIDSDEMNRIETITDKTAFEYKDNVFVNHDGFAVLETLRNKGTVEVKLSLKYFKTIDLSYLVTSIILKAKKDDYDIAFVFRNENDNDLSRVFMITLEKIKSFSLKDFDLLKEEMLAAMDYQFRGITKKLRGRMFAVVSDLHVPLRNMKDVYCMFKPDGTIKLIEANKELFINYDNENDTRENIDSEFKFQSNVDTVKIIRKILNYKLSEFLEAFKTPEDLDIDIEKHLKDFENIGLNYSEVLVVIKFLSIIRDRINGQRAKLSTHRKFVKLIAPLIKELILIKITYIVRDDDYVRPIFTQCPHERSGHKRTYRKGQSDEYTIWVDSYKVHDEIAS